MAHSSRKFIFYANFASNFSIASAASADVSSLRPCCTFRRPRQYSAHRLHTLHTMQSSHCSDTPHVPGPNRDAIYTVSKTSAADDMPCAVTRSIVTGKSSEKSPFTAAIIGMAEKKHT